jgi:hypothetical protein
MIGNTSLEPASPARLQENARHNVGSRQNERSPPSRRFDGRKVKIGSRLGEHIRGSGRGTASASGGKRSSTTRRTCPFQVEGVPVNLRGGIRTFVTRHFLLDLLHFVAYFLGLSLQSGHVLSNARSSGLVSFDIEFLKVLLERLNQIKKFLVPVHRGSFL